ncbi:MAG: hypothetical protein AAGL98_13070, partial [Planctomycetota bacterium]
PLVSMFSASSGTTSGMTLDAVLDYVEKQVRASTAYQYNEAQGVLPGDHDADRPAAEDAG